MSKKKFIILSAKNHLAHFGIDMNYLQTEEQKIKEEIS